MKTLELRQNHVRRLLLVPKRYGDIDHSLFTQHCLHFRSTKSSLRAICPHKAILPFSLSPMPKCFNSCSASLSQCSWTKTHVQKTNKHNNYCLASLVHLMRRRIIIVNLLKCGMSWFDINLCSSRQPVFLTPRKGLRGRPLRPT